MDFDVVFCDGPVIAFIADFATSQQDFEPGFQAITIVTEHWGDEIYQGPYEATPTVSGLVLETARKAMEQDVTIRPIPYYDVTNPVGGRTIYIANEV